MALADIHDRAFTALSGTAKIRLKRISSMIIITGGAGFIGSNLVAALEARGETGLVVCDWLGKDDKWKNIAKRDLDHVVRPDRLFDFLDAHAGEIKAVFHMGAISATTERDADHIAENNIALTQKLWAWCADYEVRLIYASSAATYGDGLEGFTDDDTPDALARLQPLNPYGWSKHFCDRYFSRQVRAGAKVPPQWAGLKFFNVYGPNEYHKGDMMSVICRLYPQIVSGETAKLFKSNNPDYADGGQIRDFVYVNDCVEVMLWLYDHPDVSGLFNVGSGQGRSFRDLVEAAFKAIGKPSKITYIDMPDGLKNKYQYYTQADISKLRRAGFDRPMTRLEDGVADYIGNYMSRPDTYR